MAIKNIKERLQLLNCIVMIPTYNNEKTLLKVVEDVRAYSNAIMIVNDGSTDSTSSLLSQLSDVHIVSYEKNRGKGYAIRTGIKEANSLGYDYVITIDSDGQHFAEDIENFVVAEESENHTLLVGARNLQADNMPSKNTFANKFSNFWFWAETGKHLSDTQSGFRLYPVKELSKIHFLSSRYEFEVEVLVKAVWCGLSVKNIPIKVYYPPEEERVSHFRPAKDFTRISILNTYLVLIALLFYYPWRFIRSLTPSNIKKFIGENITNSTDSNLKMSMSVGLGAFCSVLPAWGFQMWIALAIAHLCKLNKVITFAFTNISIPPLIPFILFAGYAIGCFLLGNSIDMLFEQVSIQSVSVNLWQYLLGSIVLAIIVGFVFFIVSQVFLSLFRNKK